ncbi:MAG: class I SAM-dependent methyltransferase, partial [Chloroflexi bacterium]|nr:class I SAM-dependent methyltransferase [Chloroflexota bacterium]
MKASHYWDGIIREWLADDRDALWRRYSDALHVALFRRWLGGVPSEALLKTDIFDEAVSEGLSALWPEHGFAVGIDISPEIVLAVRRRHPHWHVLVTDVRRLPFADGSFDTILSNSTLDHFEAVPEIHRALGELHRILRPGGKLLLTLDNAANPIIALRQALPGRLLQRLGLVPYAIGATVGPYQLKKMLEATSFTVLEMLPVLH